MLKITAIGNLTNDVTLKTNETTGKPYAILRIASDRRYKDTRSYPSFRSVSARCATPGPKPTSPAVSMFMWTPPTITARV